MLAFLLLMSLADQPCPTVAQLFDQTTITPSRQSTYPIECELTFGYSGPILLHTDARDCDRRAGHVKAGEIWEEPNICVLYKLQDCTLQKDFATGAAKVKGKLDAKPLKD
jgi:hypothetical protein